MADAQERVNNDLGDSGQGVDETTAIVEGMTPSEVEETTGAVGALIGILTGGFVIAGAAGFIVGLVVGGVAGVAIGRRTAPPPPRWQVWR